MPRIRPISSLLAASLVLAGCAVGPRYVRPQTPQTAAGPFVSTAPEAAVNAPLPANWWRLYDDPVLDRLVGEALARNQDLKVAAANLAYARAVLGEARAGLLPTTDLTAGPSYGRSAIADANAAAAGVSPLNAWSYGAGFNAAYQVDLFGRVRRTIQAAHASADQVQAARDAVRVTVAAETAGAYANLCGYARQAEVARQSLSLAQQTYDITLRQSDLGAVSDFDLARAASALEQARAAPPALEGQRRVALFELTALLGKTPAEAPANAAACHAPPHIDRPLPVGDGTALLRRRPDVREAERALAADTARIGVAAADLYPTISLGGAIATAANSVGVLSSPTAVTLSAGPMLSWSFPNVAVAMAHVREARAAASGAAAAFQSTVLTALKETEQALTRYAAEIEHHAALTAARDRASEAFGLAQAQYKAGAISFLDLLTAQASLLGAEQALAVSDQALSADQVAVFQALGGGWEAAPVVGAAKRSG